MDVAQAGSKKRSNAALTRLYRAGNTEIAKRATMPRPSCFTGAATLATQ